MERLRHIASAMRALFWLMLVLGFLPSLAAAAPVTFTVNASEPVTVTGTPRIAIDVGGVTRYANFVSNTGNALTFAYQVQAGDFDLDGISLSSPLDLNGGSITDVAGNPLSSLNFTAPGTTNLKVQTYQPAFTAPITNTNANAVSFTISKLPTVPANSYSYSYAISGANGGAISAGPISYSASSVTVSGLDLSAWPTGAVTLTVTVTGPSGAGQPRSITVTPSFTGRPLDALPASASAYSVRQLRSAYNGALLQVRRASDNAQQNIGATLAGTLDAAALSSFCGSSSCFVTTWYDQSGTGNDAVQATTTRQPRIMNGGAVEKNGAGQTALRTLNVNSALNAGPPMANSAEFTIIMSLQTSSIANQWAWGMTRWPGQVSSNCPWGDGNCYFDVGATSGTPRLSVASGVTAGTPYVATFGNSVSASTQFIRINGALRGSDATGHSVALEALSIMNNYEYTGVRNNLGQIGTVSEFVIFPSLLSLADRQSVEQSMIQAFGP